MAVIDDSLSAHFSCIDLSDYQLHQHDSNDHHHHSNNYDNNRHGHGHGHGHYDDDDYYRYDDDDYRGNRDDDDYRGNRGDDDDDRRNRDDDDDRGNRGGDDDRGNRGNDDRRNRGGDDDDKKKKKNPIPNQKDASLNSKKRKNYTPKISFYDKKGNILKNETEIMKMKRNNRMDYYYKSHGNSHSSSHSHSSQEHHSSSLYNSHNGNHHSSSNSHHHHFDLDQLAGEPANYQSVITLSEGRKKIFFFLIEFKIFSLQVYPTAQATEYPESDTFFLSLIPLAPFFTDSDNYYLTPECTSSTPVVCNPRAIRDENGFFNADNERIYIKVGQVVLSTCNSACPYLVDTGICP